MAFINFQPRPHIPPIAFFEPISVDPQDMMTDVEFLLGVLKKLNEVIAQTNKNTKFIDDYSGKIEEIEAEIQALRNEMDSFELEVNQTIALQFAEIKVELQSIVSTILIEAKAYTDAVASNLEQEIQNISLGQIRVFDNTTGVYTDLQTALNNLYDAGRDEALTATEYDALDLSATAYDAYDLTASQYDTSGKTLLV